MGSALAQSIATKAELLSVSDGSCSSVRLTKGNIIQMAGDPRRFVVTADVTSSVPP